MPVPQHNTQTPPTSLENAARSHEGQHLFTFDIAFSVEPNLSFKTLQATGGTVKKANRIEADSNDR